MDYTTYITILEEELVPALGCTEPIAIAFAAARARKLLGTLPEKMVVECSGNIIKNVKGVVVPNSGGLKGVSVAAILGAVGGDSEKKLETLSKITEEHRTLTQKLINTEGYCSVKLLEGVSNLHLRVLVYYKEDEVIVEITNSHTNIVFESKNGKVLFKSDADTSQNQTADRSVLNVKDIITFAETVDLSLVEEVLNRQIDYNTKIANEGLENSYGANIGKTLLNVYGDDVKIRAKAMPAAGSDARMSGCVLPVVTNSGSGNQGMTVSLPVIEYAKEFGVAHEELLQALIISNLVSIYQKSQIGKLSAYCGAVSAACGSGAAITYMQTKDYDKVCSTITNTLANTSGIVCDGAKSSCAAKIASSVDATIMAHYMTMTDNTFVSGDGIVKDNVDKTMENVGRVGKEGMKQTDIEILNIMIEDE